MTSMDTHSDGIYSLGSKIVCRSSLDVADNPSHRGRHRGYRTLDSEVQIASAKTVTLQVTAGELLCLL